LNNDIIFYILIEKIFEKKLNKTGLRERRQGYRRKIFQQNPEKRAIEFLRSISLKHFFSFFINIGHYWFYNVFPCVILFFMLTIRRFDVNEL